MHSGVLYLHCLQNLVVPKLTRITQVDIHQTFQKCSSFLTLLTLLLHLNKGVCSKRIFVLVNWL